MTPFGTYHPQKEAHPRKVHSWYGDKLDKVNWLAEPKRSQEIAALRREVDDLQASRPKKDEESIHNAQQRSWSSYAKYTNIKQRELFEKNYQAFNAAVAQLVDERTDDLLVWLKSTALLDTLTEYHNDSIEDSVAFEDKVGNALLGIGSSSRGSKLLEAWVAEAKVTEPNLVWRSVALNHTKSAEELSQALQEAEEYKNERTLASALKWVDRANKTLKFFATTHKNAFRLRVANENARAGSAAHGVTLRPVNTRDIDVLAMTIGDKVVQRFRIDRMAEYASEKLIQHVFSLRALVDPEDSAKLIEAQAEHAEAVRREMLERQRAGTTLLAMDQPPLKTTHSEAYQRAWGDFKTKARASAPGESGPSVLKDCKISILVFIIEGFNFTKLLVESRQKNDRETYVLLSASAMTMTSALFDVATVPAKEIFVSDSMTLQRLKLAGGLLSVGATLVGVWFDAQEVSEAYKRDDLGLAGLYFFKATLGGIGALATLITTFTYSAPLIGRLTGSTALETAITTAGSSVETLIGRRLLFVLAGLELTMLIFGIQLFIWYFYPNELQKWLEKCALGVDRDRGWTVGRQRSELENALESMGPHKEEKKP